MFDICEAARQRQASMIHALAQHAQTVRDFERLTSPLAEHTASIRELRRFMSGPLENVKAECERFNDLNLSLAAGPLASIQAEFDKTKNLISGLSLSDLHLQMPRFDALRASFEFRPTMPEVLKMSVPVFDIPSMLRTEALTSTVPTFRYAFADSRHCRFDPVRRATVAASLSAIRA